MIKKIKKTVEGITKKEVEKTQAFKMGKGEYKDKDKFEFYENVKTEAGWVFAIVDGEAKGLQEILEPPHQMTSIHEIVECSSEEECLVRIKELGLIYIDPEI